MLAGWGAYLEYGSVRDSLVVTMYKESQGVVRRRKKGRKGRRSGGKELGGKVKG
jgi:hypothetical protein